MAQINFHEFETPQVLAKALAEKYMAICDMSAQAPSFAFSGGNTPKLLLNALAKPLSALPYGVKIALVDERWVPPSSARSNEAMVKKQLAWPMREGDRNFYFLSLWQEGETIEKAAQNAGRSLHDHTMLPFDGLVLGMGNDGHTASWFPQSCERNVVTAYDQKALYAPVYDKPGGEARITLTLPAILQSKNIFLHIEGLEKRQIFDKALAHNTPDIWPICHILHHPEVDIEVYWAP